MSRALPCGCRSDGASICEDHRFEHHITFVRADDLWHAVCSCGWHDWGAERQVQVLAATHDLRNTG